MISRLVFLLFCGNIALNPGNAQKLPRVKRQSLKVQINATGDAVCMRYIRPSPSTKLEGFILGYGSSFFSNQYIPLPSDGKSYITEVDAEPRYLIAVRSAPAPNYKKSCSGQTKTPKPLQLVIGTLTPTSVFLSWGILVNPKHDWTTMTNCANDRFYTVRYREKDKNKKWVLQLCPTTETVIDNLKPNTIYEFGVKDNTDNGIWSKIFNHKVAATNKNKENGQLQNNYKLPKIYTQLTSGDSKALVPITIIKQDFNGTQQKLPRPLPLDISERPKKMLVDNETQEWPAESKTSEVQQISPHPQPVSELDWESRKPTVSTVSEELESSPAPKVKDPLSNPKTTISPHVLQTKPAPKPARRVPVRPKTSPSPGLTTTKPSQKGSRRVPSKPKTSPSPNVAQTKPVSSKPQRGGTTTESPRLKTAPHKVYLTTVKPRSRQVINKTTPAPGRTRTPGGVTWGMVSRGNKLTDQDATRLLSSSSSTSSNTSVDSTVARKKPVLVATPPDSPRPPLAPAKPTPIRRKPLPPNTVTGKPGSSGNLFIPRAPSFSSGSSTAKPSGPTAVAKTSSPKKQPTVSSSPDYSNTTLFSSHPTTETDSSGKTRFTGDHVKYMKKEEDVPCSITDTLKHFPTEEGDYKDAATSPPQNPPTNLTVVTVEGCSSFVVLDWKPPENDTVTEYKVVSTANGDTNGNDKSVITTNQTHSTVENLKPNTSYEFVVIASNPLGEGPSSEPKQFNTESADPRVNEPISMGKDAIWTEIKFSSDNYSECKGKQYVKRTWYKKFVGVQICNSLRYKIYLSDSLTGKFYSIGDQRGYGEDHCQFVDSYLDGRTGQQLRSDQLPTKDGFFRAVRQEPVKFGKIGAETHTNYVHWYECGTTIPGKW